MIAGEINKVMIIGMGALGVMYGNLLTEKLGNDGVIFLADTVRKRRYEENGVFCNGKRCTFRIQDAHEPNNKAELLIFAVKSNALLTAIEMARPYIDDNTIILSVMNGISSEEIIGKQLGSEHVIYCIAQGMDAVKIGNELTYTSVGTLHIGINDDETAKLTKLNMAEALLKKTGIACVVEEDILHRLWSKWMLNVGVNQVVMIKEGTYRTIQENGEARAMMIAAMEEVIALAEKEDIPVGISDLEYYIALIDSLNPDGMPSMRQDGLTGRPSEVELFSGTVIKKAALHGLDVPVNQELYRIIREMEQKT